MSSLLCGIILPRTKLIKTVTGWRNLFADLITSAGNISLKMSIHVKNKIICDDLGYLRPLTEKTP